MQPGGALLAVGSLAFFAWLAWGRGLVGRRRGARLYASLLQDASVDAATSRITGGYQGSELTVRFAQRAEPGSSAVSDCTEVILSQLPEELHLSLSHRRGNSFRLGWTPTCDTGDAAFDRSFWVEGAPVVWVVGMLTPDVRAALLRARYVQLTIENQTLVCTYFSFFSDPSAATSFLSLALALRASALERRAEAVDRKVQESASSGYRGDAEEAAAHALDAEKEQAVAFVQDRDARLASSRRTLRIAQLVFVLGIAGLYLSRGHC